MSTFVPLCTKDHDHLVSGCYSVGVLRVLNETTKEEISSVSSFLHISNDFAKKLLITTSVHVKEERLKTFEQIRATAPSEQELDRKRAKKFKPILITTKS